MQTIEIIERIVVLYGAYNIISALTILQLLEIPYIRNIHFDMITDYDKEWPYL